MHYLDARIAWEEKAFDGERGTFEGYAAMFGNVDLGGDVIERGAFKEFQKNSEGRVVVCNQHNRRDPIGTAEVTQDDKGLRFKGALVLDVPSARSVYALMRAKAVEGMSIGYDVLEGGGKILESGIRQLKALKLWEISPVTFGMNPLAGVLDVKGLQDMLGAGKLPSLKEFEAHLREAGFSKTQAAAIAGKGLAPLLRSESGSNGVAAAVKAARAALTGTSST